MTMGEVMRARGETSTVTTATSSEGKCEGCGGPVAVSASGAPRRWCSNACRHKAARAAQKIAASASTNGNGRAKTITGVRKAPVLDESGLTTGDAPEPHSPTVAELMDFARASGAEELRLRGRGVVLTITTDAP